ncbi:MAG: adenylyl-sulfate kinase [Alphaproteobacteria bacterium]|nr:adenylyl-sulfate kinase [Alphaproteobacteria bacterium]
MLIIFGGLLGTGKTTISRALAEKIGAVHLRIDTIETAIANSDLHAKDTNAGYLAAYGIARDNLLIGRTVIADSVNSIKVTRDDWQEVAKSADTSFIEIEVLCSDKKEHQKRIECRVGDIEGHKLPTWQEVVNREYEEWKTKNITIDTATQTLDQTIEAILNFLSRPGGNF